MKKNIKYLFAVSALLLTADCSQKDPASAQNSSGESDYCSASASVCPSQPAQNTESGSTDSVIPQEVQPK